MNTSQSAPSPFALAGKNRPQSLVALCGLRNGYLQLATREPITTYETLPISLFEAAKDWAATLENSGSPRVYWITLSEVVNHLHVHLYPRWEEDSLKGIPLFEQREQSPQPQWTPDIRQALDDWAKEYDVLVIHAD